VVVQAAAPFSFGGVKRVLPVPGPDDLAYVMFTSGSTGAPKGIEITHRGVVDLVTDAAWGFTAADRVLFQAPHAFDGSTYEIWGPLLAGAAIVVAPPSVTAGVLRELIAGCGVTKVSLTAGVFRVIADHDPGAVAGLTEVTTGGDVVSADAVRAVRAVCPVRTTYGPTEITLCATHALYTAVDVVPAVVPLGAPMTGTRLYLLDESLNPVAPGVIAEIYIAGTGLARGYRTAAATAVSFVAAPGGQRLYRTGDLGRWGHDGTLTFHGRIDQQVKIRGYRIEPAEIEHALTRLDGVRQAAVVVRRTPAGNAQIHAYYTGTVEQVRDALAAVLPEYQIPATVTRLDTWPLTRNGKLDQTRLPDRPVTRPARTPREEQLCRLFTDVLETPIGPDDNFFHHGGHSLLALRLTNLINETQQVQITPAVIFEHASPHRLATHLNQRGIEPQRERPVLARRPRPA
jgi:pristinamycin I synthase-3/4